MPLVRIESDPVVLRLNRDLVRMIKRGHPWVYADALRDLPRSVPGSLAVLLDNRKGSPIAVGFYDPKSAIAFRVCAADGETKLDDRWCERRLRTALSLRRSMFDESTTGYRLLNGEGDQTPGLVLDVYGESAVIKLDGPGPFGFWNVEGIAEWVANELKLSSVFERKKERGREGNAIIGSTPKEPVRFLENGINFTADIVHGQKTGFFLDQRDNRRTIRSFSNGRTVLNLFSYTGGFSVSAGCGGARKVTSVDLAKPAVQTADLHWEMNQLPPNTHDAVDADAFDFLNDAIQHRKKWGIVIADPPSFAPNQESVSAAKKSYQSLIELSARVAERGGLLAAASCSSHIDLPMFLELCEEGVSDARRRATVIAVQGQPADHPTPLALPEFRYLKFVLMQLD